MIKMYKVSSGIEYDFDNVESLECEIRRYIIDVALPEQDNPDIMTIGGVDKHVSFVAVVVSDSIDGEVGKLMEMFGTGKVCEKFLISIDEWGLENEMCVVERVRIRQVAGEPSMIKVEVNLIIGNVLC